MSKPEPLKWTQEDILYMVDIIDDIEVINKFIELAKLKERSAVEWLKFEFRHIHLLTRITPKVKQRIMEKIDEAFEDVMKGEK